MSLADTQIPGYVRFAIAGLSGIGASLASHPFDLVKYRMQLSGVGSKEKFYKTSLHAVYHIASKEGYLAVYNGLSASILRQFLLTMTRVGLYSVIVDRYTSTDGTPPSLLLQMFAGVFSGALGAIVGNPADIALVRMSADGAKPENEKYNYKNCFDAIKRMIKEEGLSSFSIGWKPAVARCMILNVTQITLYKNSKIILLHSGHFQDNTTLHVICSIWTAFVSSIATSPIDIIKTRIMSEKHVKGKSSNSMDALAKIVEHEGFFALWKGFTPTFARILPNSFMVFIILEGLTKAYKTVVLGDKSGTGF